MKWIFLALIGWFVYKLFFAKKRTKIEPSSVAQTMRACEHCGVYVTEAEAHHKNGHIFCSDACRIKGVQ